MTLDFNRLCVIKTGWCEAYEGGDAIGNFTYLADGGDGAESFNMSPAADGYEVYSLRIREQMPRPEPETGWTIVHVARDPTLARGGMKIVGWYESATFLPVYEKRLGQGDRRVFNIRAERAFAFRPADRPTIDHNSKFGSGGVFWLAGNDASTSKTDWSKVRKRIIVAVEREQGKAIAGGSLSEGALADWLGSTRRPLATPDGIQIDDGGQPYGRSRTGESDEHRALRLWAKDNPAEFLQDKIVSSHTEYDLLSGDRVDAAHIGAEQIVLVEAKSRRSGEADLERGLYQCVKYYWVQVAQNIGLKTKPDVRVVLLIERALSDRLQALAARFDIEVMIKPMDPA